MESKVFASDWASAVVGIDVNDCRGEMEKDGEETDKRG